MVPCPATYRACSLVELLVCVAVVVAVLTVISVNSYDGALDQADLRYAAPGVAGRLDALRREAAAKGLTINVEFQLGDAKWQVTRRKSGAVDTLFTLPMEFGATPGLPGRLDCGPFALRSG